MNYCTFLLLLCSLLFYYPSCAQNPPLPFRDTLFFLNGSVMNVMLLDTAGERIKLVKAVRKGRRETYIDKEHIFSIKDSAGKEIIFYKQDTADENSFTTEEIRYFMQGERDAAKGYRSVLATAGGFITGTASTVFIGSIIALAPSFLYSSAVMIPKIKIRRHTVSNPDYLKYDTYIMGYERVARKKRIFNALKGAAAGLVTGLVIYHAAVK